MAEKPNPNPTPAPIKKKDRAAIPARHVGAPVMVYECTKDGLTKPLPGVINGLPDTESIVNVSTFPEIGSRYPSVYPISGVAFCTSDEQLEKIAGTGRRWACKPGTEPYQAPEKDEPEEAK